MPGFGYAPVVRQGVATVHGHRIENTRILCYSMGINSYRFMPYIPTYFALHAPKPLVALVGLHVDPVEMDCTF